LRYKLTLLPMPDIVIKYLSDLHDKDYDNEDTLQGGEPLEFQIRERVLTRNTGDSEDYDPEQACEADRTL